MNEIIKEDDMVECVDAENSFNRLIKGFEYKVEAAHDGTLVVFAGGAYHNIDRFRKIVR